MLGSALRIQSAIPIPWNSAAASMKQEMTTPAANGDICAMHRAGSRNHDPARMPSASAKAFASSRSKSLNRIPGAKKRPAGVFMIQFESRSASGDRRPASVVWRASRESRIEPAPRRGSLVATLAVAAVAVILIGAESSVNCAPRRVLRNPAAGRDPMCASGTSRNFQDRPRMAIRNHPRAGSRIAPIGPEVCTYASSNHPSSSSLSSSSSPVPSRKAQHLPAFATSDSLWPAPPPTRRSPIAYADSAKTSSAPGCRIGRSVGPSSPCASGCWLRRRDGWRSRARPEPGRQRDLFLCREVLDHRVHAREPVHVTEDGQDGARRSVHREL